MENLVILKLGGSSITKKRENKFEMNNEVVDRAAKEISLALRKKKFDLIIICGVGPFGHTNVKTFGINDGVKTSNQLDGVRITNRACDSVGEAVATALESNGVKAKLIPGYAVCIQDRKHVTSFSTTQYTKVLEQGVVPITTGIMVKDSVLNWSVMSGDQAIAHLARQLRPKKVLIGTDVDGVFTADPRIEPKAKLVRSITKKNVHKVLSAVGASQAVDVTGGMRGKIEKLVENLTGIPIIVFNLFKKRNLESALLGKKITSTVVKL